MDNLDTLTTVEQLYRAARALAYADDGATRRDGVGYSLADTGFGNRLAQTPPTLWKPAHAMAAYRMLTKYKRQLSGMGIDFDLIPAPALPTPEKSVTLQDGLIAVRFPYKPELVEMVKAIPGRKFQANGDDKYWTLPPEGAALALAIGRKHGFDIDEEVERLAGSIPADKILTVQQPRKPTAALEEGTIVFTFEYNPDMVTEVKELPGRRWDGERKAWVVTLMGSSTEAISAFVRKWGFEMNADTAQAIGGVVAREQQAIEASRQLDSDFVVEGLGMTLYPYQRAGVAYGHEKKRLFFADEMGLGKTPMSLATAHSLDAYPILIVCPASLKLNWQREITRWLPNTLVQVIDAQTPIAHVDCTIINYDIFARRLPDLLKIRWGALICDESHRLKNHKAQRVKAVKELVKTQAMPVRMLLTGTPVLNKPAEIITQLEILGRLNDMGGWHEFASRFCGYDGGMMGARAVPQAALQELNRRLRATAYIRREKRDVFTELPPKQRVTVPVQIDNPKDYSQAEANIVKWMRDKALANNEFLASIAHLPEAEQAAAIKEHGQEAENKTRYAEELVKLNELRQLSSKGKQAAIKEWVEDFLESGEKLILFGWYTDTVKGLAEHFKAPSIMGETPIAKRQEYIDRFQNDPTCKLIVLNIEAGGVGLTLTAASNVAFTELPWRPGDIDQAEDRAYGRANDLHGCTSWFLLGRNTIDEAIMALIESKRVVVDATTIGESSTEKATSSVIGELVARYRKGK